MGRHRKRHQLAVRRRTVGVVLACAVAGALSLAALWSATSGGGTTVAEDAGVLEEEISSDGTDEIGPLLDEMGVPHEQSVVAQEGDVSQVAAAVLEECRARGDCLVVRSGYLDLSGGTWGCVLQGSGWVEIRLVSEARDGSGCIVATWRMRVEEVARFSQE